MGTSAHQIYQEIYKELKINPRTIQWYATEGYIPKPEKKGAEAFYSAEDQIPTRVRVIQLLQKRYELKLKEIKQITDKQAKADWELIYTLLTALEELFPYMEYSYNGDEYVSPKGSWLANHICEKLKDEGDVDQISLAEAEEAYETERQAEKDRTSSDFE